MHAYCGPVWYQRSHKRCVRCCRSPLRQPFLWGCNAQFVFHLTQVGCKIAHLGRGHLSPSCEVGHTLSTHYVLKFFLLSMKIINFSFSATSTILLLRRCGVSSTAADNSGHEKEHLHAPILHLDCAPHEFLAARAPVPAPCSQCVGQSDRRGRHGNRGGYPHGYGHLDDDSRGSVFDAEGLALERRFSGAM